MGCSFKSLWSYIKEDITSLSCCTTSCVCVCICVWIFLALKCFHCDGLIWAAYASGNKRRDIMLSILSVSVSVCLHWQLTEREGSCHDILLRALMWCSQSLTIHADCRCLRSAAMTNKAVCEANKNVNRLGLSSTWNASRFFFFCEIQVIRVVMVHDFLKWISCLCKIKKNKTIFCTLLTFLCENLVFKHFRVQDFEWWEN